MSPPGFPGLLTSRYPKPVKMRSSNAA